MGKFPQDFTVPLNITNNSDKSLSIVSFSSKIKIRQGSFVKTDLTLVAVGNNPNFAVKPEITLAAKESMDIIVRPLFLLEGKRPKDVDDDHEAPGRYPQPCPIIITIKDSDDKKNSLIVEQVNILDSKYFEKIPNVDTMIKRMNLENNKTVHMTYCDDDKAIQRMGVATYYDFERKVIIVQTQKTKLEVDERMRKDSVISSRVDNKKETEVHSEVYKTSPDSDGPPIWKVIISLLVDLEALFAYAIKIRIISSSGSVSDHVSIVDLLKAANS
eukprot:TRINITY_DN1309_c0_g2_i4.p1 TRINITY_DN1309_c0_g2~~TRINITY_DN1309_c0_g2_i4.p1  ORF type:complete len:272 (+),score=36.28 TRINITY_DN1309_c0_g2_i4:331-1146(+)